MSQHERESAAAWRDTVMRRSNGLSVISGEPATDAHHAIPQQTLRRRARDLGTDPAWLLWDARVGIALTRREHQRHTTAHERVPRECLPECVFEFAEAFGLGWWLERHFERAAA